MLKQPRAWLRARRVRRHVEAAAALRARADRSAALCELERARNLDAGNALVHCLIGQLHAEAASYDDASSSFERALALEPGYTAAYVDLATVYRLNGEFARAAEACRRALEIDPASPSAHYNLAVALVQQRAPAAALPHLRTAHAAMADRDDVLRLLVTSLLQTDAFEEARTIAQTAVDARGSYEAWLNLGLVYQKLHRPDDAMACYAAAAEQNSEDAELHNNRAIALQDLGRLDEAIQSYDAALALKPDFPLARFHRALAHLASGNFADGWRDYELRLVSEDIQPRARSYPRWDGSPLEGRSIFAYREQGLGDEIMFASCLPHLIESAGRTVIECSSKSRRLFERSFPGATVYVSDEQASLAQMHADFEVPFGSLPLYYRRAAHDFPNHSGYLKADPARVAAWRAKLEHLGPGLKVGISWRGGTYKTRSPLRSIDLEDWGPILAAPGVSFVSLQYTNDAESEISMLEPGCRSKVVHWADAITDYDETAALVSALDLTISVCTAVVHLSGALGRPVWVLAPYSPEWRYGRAGGRMPWYPSAHVFRQQRRGDWEPLLETVAARLRELSRSSAAAVLAS